MTKEQIAVAVLSSASWSEALRKPEIAETVRRLANERELLLGALQRVLDRTTSDEELTRRVSYARSLLVAVEAP